LECSSTELRYVVSTKCTLDFEDYQQSKKKVINSFNIVDCSRDIIDIFIKENCLLKLYPSVSSHDFLTVGTRKFKITLLLFFYVSGGCSVQL
jgi:hypothetical protein